VATVVIIVGAFRWSSERPPVGEPSRVVSGASPSAISFGDVHIELDPDTALVMTHEAGQPIASLDAARCGSPWRRGGIGHPCSCAQATPRSA